MRRQKAAIRRRIRLVLLAAMGRLAVAVSTNRTAQTVLFNAVRLDRAEARALAAGSGVRFLSYAFAQRARSRSQILQDLWVSFETDEMRGGLFVEFGATDGYTNSNTWLLEKEYGWTGILAEPNPIWHAALLSNRSARTDVRCVAPISGQWVDFIATDSTDPELSGIASYLQGDHFIAARDRGAHLEVETVSLNDLLDQHDAPARIDYLSIDTEGSEFAIMQTFDFDRHRPALLSVEINASMERQIVELLRSHGYSRVLQNLSQWDAWFVLETQ